jgi:hypothetical protein
MASVFVIDWRTVPAIRWNRLAMLLLLLSSAIGCAPVTQNTVPRQQQRQALAGDSFEIATRFGFDVIGLLTNHQFAGQRNTFRVDYEYAAILRGGGFDPAGHQVGADAYPYFQLVRNDLIEFVTGYPNRTEFYELFGQNLVRHLMNRYPQIRWLEITIEVPAHGEVQIDRRVTVRAERKDAFGRVM